MSSGVVNLVPDDERGRTESLIAEICNDIRDLLLAKNRAYGNSALKPIRVFSKANAKEQLLVRLDDKLNRIKQGNDILESDEDVIPFIIQAKATLFLFSLHKNPAKHWASPRLLSFVETFFSALAS